MTVGQRRRRVTTEAQTTAFDAAEAVEVVPGAPDPDSTDSGTSDPATGPENGGDADQTDDAGDPGA